MRKFRVVRAKEGPGVLSEGRFQIYHGKQLVADLTLEDNVGQLSQDTKRALTITNKAPAETLFTSE